MASSHAGADSASLADFFRILRLRLGLIFLIFALVVVTAVAVTALLPRWWLATTMLRVESQRSSSIIEINVYARDARLAADIANEIAWVYADDRIALATSEQREGLEKLKTELTEQEKTVSQQRDTVEK